MHVVGLARPDRQLPVRGVHDAVLRRAVLDALSRARAVRSPLLAASAGVVDDAARRPRARSDRRQGCTVGAALGVAIALLIRGTSRDPALPPIELLLGLRSTAGELLMHVVYATRTALFVFFLLFLFRLLLRNQWLAAFVFVLAVRPRSIRSTARSRSSTGR